MKRANQHPLINNLQQPGSFDPDTVVNNESGVDAPCEKDIAQTQTPSMGALPVDNIGSIKTCGEWKSIAGNEDHIAESKEQDDEDDAEIDEIIATGSGPDPEHNEERI